MAERPTEAVAEPERAATQADDVERDRVAWNLPLSTDDEASRRADRSDRDEPSPSAASERRQ
jgi:hypothetical protein